VGAALDGELHAGVLVRVRAIDAEDDHHLTAVELATLSSQLPSRRAASGTARRAARSLCRRVGVPVRDIARSCRGRPLWPAALVGSLAHDRTFAVAAIGRSMQFDGIGVDIEPPEHLPPHIGRLIGADGERLQFAQHGCGDKALFSIKEAVFKCVCDEHSPRIGLRDITIDAPSRTATIASYGSVRWCLITQPWIVAVAWRPRAMIFDPGSFGRPREAPSNSLIRISTPSSDPLVTHGARR
jgi:4'-phosphopantetheinyl transferase EntD